MKTTRLVLSAGVLVLGPLLAATIRDNKDDIGLARRNQLEPPEFLDLTVRLAFACARRVDPSLTLDAVEQLVDLENFGAVFAACWGVSTPEAAPGGSTGGAGTPVDLIDWDAELAELCHHLGWTWEAAESQLDLHRRAALHRHWREQPPVARLVAAYLDYKPPSVADAERDHSLLMLQSSMRVDTAAPKLDSGAWERHIAMYPNPLTEQADHHG